MKSNSVLTAVSALAIATGAAAHPLPKSATPAPNAVLAASPPQISITFSEGLILRFSGLEITDGAGRKAALGAPSLNPSNDRELIVPVRSALQPGLYTVSWHAVGDDTHHVSGRYTFALKR